MKADSCGGWTEQKRYVMGWITPGQVRLFGKPKKTVCGQCKHSAYKSESSRSCLHPEGGFSTKYGATCNYFEASILG